MKDLSTIELIKHNKALTAFSCLFVVIFILLGFWQIERAGSKLNLIQEFNLEQAKAPKPISSTSSPWSRVYIEGFYDAAQQVLIDNQIKNGKVGYKIYTPFYYEQNQAIFIDRGWISQGKTRNDLPNLNFNATKLRVIGSLIKPEKEVLAGDELLTNEWPLVSQTKSPKVIQEAYEKQFSEMVLILDPGSQFMNEHIALTPFVITPTKHYGYALQWFTMSLVLAGMFIYAIKRES
jgi:surfeit locus 1 family protein